MGGGPRPFIARWAQKRPSVPVADVLKWKADVDGTEVDQKQVKGGLIQYSMDKEKEYMGKSCQEEECAIEFGSGGDYGGDESR